MTHSTMNGGARLGLSRAKRYKTGRELRQLTPREWHAGCPPPSSRDPAAILRASDAERIPELLPKRYKRMKKSPYSFLRGAAAVMAHDLSCLPIAGIPVQACGDCHLMNFGVFSTPEGRVLFDINDFDETLPGADFSADLKRLVASVAVAALDVNMPPSKARAIARATAKSYREFILELAAKSPLEIWYTRMDIAREVRRIGENKLRGKLFSTFVKAKKDLAADDNFPHLAKAKTGSPRIEDRPPLIYHFKSPESREYKIHAHAAFTSYIDSLQPERRILMERYALCDIAFKVVGVGSVGTFCAIGLFVTPDGEPLFLQVKQALRSVLERLTPPPPGLAHQGNRVVEGQRAMQAASDIFLGWTEDPKTNRYFYVRQLKNHRLGSIGEVMAERELDAYATLCGRTLARAHARTGDPAVLAGYMGNSEVLDDALASFAMAYAAQTKHDHSEFKAALRAKEGLAAG
ncbi:MAG: DUF2252 domain-containing protein [Beijerinckiaceae bacterium]|nr:DUF2252 domain-containing protein [Beijerinckiaceae bacterium]